MNKAVNKSKSFQRPFGQPDFEGAKSYVLGRLERELAPNLFYHSLEHTRDDVWPAAKRLAALAGVTGEDLVLLQTAALYHDIGFVKQTHNHESVSSEITQEVLPDFGYSREQIERINDLIMVTKLPQNPKNLLEELMADADLDVLGRDDFFISTHKLQAELRAYGRPTTQREWYRIQLHFLKSHRYFSTVAKVLREEQKQRNIEGLKALLVACQEPV